MESTKIALKLLLDSIGVPADVGKLEGRKLIQKAVYLGQRAGVDLGYRFGWYLMGPYSPDLARDYYVLDTELRTGSKDYENHTLSNRAREAVGIIKPALVPPRDSQL